jgi:hypothetical protein
MARICSQHGRLRNADMRMISMRKLNGRDHLVDLGVEERILKWV